MTEPTNLTDIRLRCLEIAERTVYFQSRKGDGAYGNYDDKSMAEIMHRADKLLTYTLSVEMPDTQTGLIERLRQALCDKP